MKPILVAGEINADLVFTGCEDLPTFGHEVLVDDFRMGPGSSAMIFAIGLARLGASVAFAGVAGQDRWGDYCLNALRLANVDVQAVQQRAELQTGLTVALSSRQDRALVTYPGAMAALTAADIDDAWLARGSHLHVASYYLQHGLRAGLGDLFRRARALGLTTSLDPGFDPAQQWGDAWPELLAQVDVFLPNTVEALAISGAATVEKALAHFANGSTTTIIKCGSNGCVVLSDDGQLMHCPTVKVDALDSTGAGDSFDAGFLYAWKGGHSLHMSMRWGAVCGALSTRGIGGTAAQATFEEVRTLLELAP